ncbi:MAG: diguanylate cyclase [Lachnospiraceae bacterium]|nr:diguanylate cyclase [Lachnospiraceae bacterium]
MYEFLLWFQGLSIPIAFMTMIVFFPSWKNRIHAYLFIFTLSVTVNNLGYFLVMVSDNPIDSLWGTKIEYLGKLFISVALLFFMTEYTGARISEYTKRTVAIIHAIIGILVFTCEHHNIYYENGTDYVNAWTTEGLFPHIEFEHGIFYYIYVMMVAGYLIFAIVSAVRRLMNERRNRLKVQTAIIVCIGLVMVLGLIVFSTGIMGGYDATVISYLLCLVLMIIATIKYDLIAALDAVKNYIADNMTEGIVAVDTEGAIIYSNLIAERIYPSLKERDESVISQLIESIEKDEVINIRKNYYKVEQSELKNERKIFGNLYVIDDITIEYNHNKELKLRSITDGMTGLLNRSETVRRIEEAMGSEGVSLVMIDIDNFKVVNDSFGHDVGDTVIKGVANIMLDLTYTYPKFSAGRWGGEEFMLVIPRTDVDSAMEVAEKIRTEFAQTEFKYAGFRTVSLGVTVLAENDDADALCKRADEALYTSKQEGKNRVTLK